MSLFYTAEPASNMGASRRHWNRCVATPAQHPVPSPGGGPLAAARGSVAVLVVGGLVALAAPAFAPIGQAANVTVERVSDIMATPGPTEQPGSEPVAETAAEPRDPLQAAAWKIGCDDFAAVGGYAGASRPSPRPDRGPSEYASGSATMGADGGVETYTVAAGDSGMSIGERFCVDYVTLLVANGKWPPAQTIQPGDVLLINLAAASRRG